MNTTPAPAADISALLSAAQTHAAEDRPEMAAQCFESALAQDPKNTSALIGMANIAMRNRNFRLAWKYAAPATQVLPTAANLTLLADIAWRLGHPDQALRYYSVALQTSPNHTPALSGLGEVYEDLGYRARAIACYKKIMTVTPRDLAALQRLTKLSDHTDSQRLVDFYEQARPLESDSLVAKLKFQSLYVARKEAAERHKRGLTPHAFSPDDLPIRFACEERDALETMADAALAENPTEGEALHYKGYCLLARGMLADAEYCFHAYAANRAASIYHTMFFNDGFYHALENTNPSTLTQALPPLTEITKQTFTDGTVIFLSCDILYFLKFARPLLASVNNVAHGVQIHAHIMNATPEQLEKAALFCTNLTQTKIAISAEDACALTRDQKTAKLYFHAIRFIRMFQYLTAYQRPLWLMDVDGLMNRDPRGIIDTPDNADLMLFGHAGRWQPWFKFNASVVGIRPSPQGIRYLRLVATYISQLHRQNLLWWGIDQFVLYGVYEFLRRSPDPPTVGMLPIHMLDGKYTPEGIVWNNGTTAKFRDISSSGLIKEPPDSPRVRYLAALEKYMPAEG